MRIHIRLFPALAAAGLTLTLGQETPGQAPPDYDFQWRTVGAPANAPARPEDFPFYVPGPRGAVNYEFRMATMEVTVAQYFEFVQAYTTVYPDTPNDSVFKGDHIMRDPRTLQWYMLPGTSNLPANMGWNYAAMYCNWLCHSKAGTADAFSSGAYDTGTFYPNPGDPQVVHTPGAQFWLASMDEWTKAMYYDPNRYGPGQPGYWWYQTRSDSPPVGGLPGTPGAQTGAGNYDSPPPNGGRLFPVGSYPDAPSPWGILDGSGGLREWTEGVASYEFRWLQGSQNLDLDTSADRIGGSFNMPFYTASGGIRLVSSVPTPGTVILFVGVPGLASVRRRR